MTQSAPPSRPRGIALLAAFWAVLGVTLLLSSAVYRLTPKAVQAILDGLTPFQWALLVANVVFMAWSEGYRGFQKGFSPRVAVRAMHLAAHPKPLHVLLAPPYAMGLVHATKRRLIVSWSLTIGIVGLVILVRLLPQPWRGIVDAGVVTGLVWGIVALIGHFLRLLAGHPAPVPTETPDSASRAGGGELRPAA
jgi:hypothetical protein